MSGAVKLWGYWRSSASWRVRIALAHKGIDYDYLPVHLVKDGGQQFSDEHRARNPLEQVPVLEVDGVRLTQSMAILEWLEETHPEPPLLPRDPVGRARARQLAEIVNSGIQPLQNLSAQKYVKSVGGDPTAWAAHWVKRGLGAMEAIAKETAGRYLVGEEVSFADVCLIPQLYGARRVEVDLAPYPTLVRVEAACAELEAFRKAHADAQIDAVS